jgi:hypothetical protein
MSTTGVRVARRPQGPAAAQRGPPVPATRLAGRRSGRCALRPSGPPCGTCSGPGSPRQFLEPSHNLTNLPHLRTGTAGRCRCRPPDRTEVIRRRRRNRSRGLPSQLAARCAGARGQPADRAHCGRVPGRNQPSHPTHGAVARNLQQVPDASPVYLDVDSPCGRACCAAPAYERRPAAGFPVGRTRFRCPSCDKQSTPSSRGTIACTWNRRSPASGRTRVSSTASFASKASRAGSSSPSIHSCRLWKTKVSRCLAMMMLPCSSRGILMYSGRKRHRARAGARLAARVPDGTSAPDAPLAWGGRAGRSERIDERQ